MINVKVTSTLDKRNEGFFVKFLIFLINKDKHLLDFDAIDIGANIGFYSIFMAAKFRKVWSFEPDKENFSKLISHPRLVIEYINKAVAAHDGQINLFVSNNCTNHIACYANNDAGLFEMMKVDCITLNTFCRGKEVAFIKCDVEGGEDFIFNEEAAGEAMREQNTIIALECHPGVKLDKLYNNFINYGFTQFYCDTGKVDKLDLDVSQHYLLGKDGAKEILEEYYTFYKDHHFTENEYNLNVTLL